MAFSLGADAPMTGRTVVVTGATRGIGLSVARAVAESGATVVCVGRDPERVTHATDDIASRAASLPIGVVADFGDFEQVRAAADTILASCERIDVLVNNAGLIVPARAETVDGHEVTWQVDYLSPFLLTMSLAPALVSAAPSRVITVSSDAHFAAWRGLDFDDLDHTRSWSSFGAYSAAKLADIMFAAELSHRWAPLGITSNSVHPGLVRTGFGRTGDFSERSLWNALNPWSLSADEGADTPVFLASSPAVEGVSGQYFYKRRPKLPSRAARDVDAQRRLWSRTVALLGLEGEPEVDPAAVMMRP